MDGREQRRPLRAGRAFSQGKLRVAQRIHQRLGCALSGIGRAGRYACHFGKAAIGRDRARAAAYDGHAAIGQPRLQRLALRIAELADIHAVHRQEAEGAHQLIAVGKGILRQRDGLPDFAAHQLVVGRADVQIAQRLRAIGQHAHQHRAGGKHLLGRDGHRGNQPVLARHAHGIAFLLIVQRDGDHQLLFRAAGQGKGIFVGIVLR